MAKCPPGVFCIENMTLVFIIIVILLGHKLIICDIVISLKDDNFIEKNFTNSKLKRGRKIF